MRRLIFGLAILAAIPAFAEKWKIQYFYDENRETFTIEDLACPSANRCVAVGSIVDESGKKKTRYSAVVSSDGGAHWTPQPLTEHPRSLFFLNDSQGWMVTDDAFWYTEESGRSWKRIAGQIKADRKISNIGDGGRILKVWFLTTKHGYAIGLQKSVFETKDGAQTWTPLIEAAQPPGNPAYTSYTHMYFEGKVGLIFGSNRPPRRDDPALPTWMEPERAVKRSTVPVLALQLKTTDGGEKWVSSSATLLGAISSLRFAGNDSLSIYQYDQTIRYPSEVFHLDTSTGKLDAVYRSNLRVMDAAMFANHRVFLAAIEPPGRLNTLPIPGKVKVLTSTTFGDWKEMDVDYKANARMVMMAGPDPEHVWIATDTGMILRLQP